MAAVFKKKVSIAGVFKNITCNGNDFVDFETGEVIPVCEILHHVYGDAPFDISSSRKEDNDIE